MQVRRAAWSRSRIRHQVKPRQQAFRTSQRHKWPPDDTETSLIWQEALPMHPQWPTQMRLKTSSMMIWILWFLQHLGQTHPPRGLQCQSGHRPPDLGRSDWIWRCREVQQQWTPPFKEVCRALITDHQHSLRSTNSQKDNMDAPSLQTLASHWLCHSAKVGQTGCQSD